MAALVTLVALLPLVGLVGTAWGSPRSRAVVGVVTAVATTVAAVTLAAQVHATASAGAALVRIGGLELGLVADGFAVAFVLTTCVVGLAVGSHAAYEDLVVRWPRPRGYWPTFLALWACLHVLFLAADLLTAYLMLELIGVTGAALVALGGDRPTVLAATRYFFAELVASTTTLAGLALLWHRAGTLVFADLATVDASDGLALPLAIVTTGLLLKVPLVPLHGWLPPAHALAPSAVSPVLSAVVVKSAFAVLARLWFVGLPDVVTTHAAQLLGVLGAIAVVWGSINALRDRTLKLLVAHSTVAQLGLLFLVVPLVAGGGPEAWAGGVVLAVSHGLAKAAMLLAAAILVEDLGRSQVADLGGAAARRPVAVLAFGVAAVSLVGLPPSGGFVAKWYLLVASLEAGQWWWVPVVVLGSLLTAGYLMRVVKVAFAPSPPDLPGTPARDARDVVALVLALSTLLLGLRPTELLELLEVASPFPLVGG
jgi:multicomponent Na+:H+ antiporter subunit D